MIWREITNLLNRVKGSKKLHRPGRRSRYGDFPDNDLYDSVDIEDVSYKRNSGTAFFRRSGDFSKPFGAMDNPAYRRSFELRPQMNRLSWYDPDAANYEYSQRNANLVPGTNRSPENRRSLSASRLQDRNLFDNNSRRSRGRSSSTIHDHIPKTYIESDSGIGNETEYYKRNGFIPNGVYSVTAHDRNGSGVPYEQRSHAHAHSSYRSRSFDPYVSNGSWPGEEACYRSLEKTLPRSIYKKNDSLTKMSQRSRKDKHNRKKENGISSDRFHRSASFGRDSVHNNVGRDSVHNNVSRGSVQNNVLYSPKYRNSRSEILSSNLQPVAYGLPQQADRQRQSYKNSNRNDDEYYLYSPQYNPSRNTYTTKL